MTRVRSSPFRWITHAAFLLALVVVIARLTTPDVLRDPWEPAPGADPTPAGAGVATGLVFDLLACLPGVLVLMRRALDREFRLVFHWSHCLIFGLGIWAVLSTAWSADRFAAAATAAHFFAAVCLLWAMSQLVRSFGRFRLVSALSFGLLLVLLVQAVVFRFVDEPENLNYWNQKKTDILKAHDWAPDSFAARQFEQKLTNGELVGFFNSANSLAAVAVLLFFACAGIGIQKLKDKEPLEWIAVALIAAGSLVWILIGAKSKTSAATPFLGVALLAVVWPMREQIFRHRWRAYLAGVALVVLALLAVVGHGIYHHGLFPGHFSNSLDFRWKYWIASTRIFADHPWIGIGWGNFGLHYLAHRLPEAAEEIKDPHNFLVRFFVELGVVGGALCVAWLLRLAWEFTGAPVDATDHPEDDDLLSVRAILIVILLGMGISVFANTDLSLGLVDLLNLLMKPTLYLLALMLGTIGAAMLSPHEWSLDRRPAPWIFACFITGLALFLLHNLIDFSLFEAGALMLFMAWIGSALGMKSADPKQPAPRPLLWAAGLAAVFAWLGTAIFFVAPVTLAEQDVLAGNEMIRTTPADNSREAYQHFKSAGDDFAAAASLVPYNCDYVFKQAQTAIQLGEVSHAIDYLASVRRMNPLLIDGYLLDANLRLHGEHPDIAAVRNDFETILKLNPNDVSFHIQFANALTRFGMQKEAGMQYRAALAANDALPIGEPRRLTAAQVADLQSKTPGTKYSN